jgi:hypothetical protein
MKDHEQDDPAKLHVDFSAKDTEIINVALSYKMLGKLGVVACTCHPTKWKGLYRRIMVLGSQGKK